jgi:peptide deformylase
MELIKNDNPILHTACEKFDFLNPQVNIVEFANTLISTMNENFGLGLAANQIGEPLQIFAMRGEQPIIVINPQILEYSTELVELEEGCLSYSGQYPKIKRPIWIKARFNLVNGQKKTFRFEGITARVFQHEFDHVMTGAVMFDKMSKLKREMYFKKMKKNVKGNK